MELNDFDFKEIQREVEEHFASINKRSRSPVYPEELAKIASIAATEAIRAYHSRISRRLQSPQE